MTDPVTITLNKAGTGPGSRGGVVIGKTRSGKPIYQGSKASASAYKDFTAEDHTDAWHAHTQHLAGRKDKGHLTLVGDDKTVSYADQAKHGDSHRAKMFSMAQKKAAAERDASSPRLGKTGSGKDVHLDRKASDHAYAKFTSAEHHEAAKLHSAHAETLTHDRYNMKRQFDQALGHLQQAKAKLVKEHEGKVSKGGNKPLGAAYSHARKVSSTKAGQRAAANRYLKKKGHGEVKKAAPAPTFGAYQAMLANQAMRDKVQDDRYVWTQYQRLFDLNRRNMEAQRQEALLRQMGRKP